MFPALFHAERNERDGCTMVPNLNVVDVASLYSAKGSLIGPILVPKPIALQPQKLLCGPTTVADSSLTSTTILGWASVNQISRWRDARQGPF